MHTVSTRPELRGLFHAEQVLFMGVFGPPGLGRFAGDPAAFLGGEGFGAGFTAHGGELPESDGHGCTVLRGCLHASLKIMLASMWPFCMLGFVGGNPARDEKLLSQMKTTPTPTPTLPPAVGQEQTPALEIAYSEEHTKPHVLGQFVQAAHYPPTIVYSLAKLHVYSEGNGFCEICTGEGINTRNIAFLRGPAKAIESDAEQIVHACNTHAAHEARIAALVEALKTILHDHATCVACEQPGFLTDSQIDQACAALALAKGTNA